MIAIETTRMNIIRAILNIHDLEVLQQLEQQATAEQDNIHTIQKKKLNVLDAVTEIKPPKSLEEIVKEQNYKPISYKEFRALADKIQIKEPIEDLLAMLTK